MSLSPGVRLTLLLERFGACTRPLAYLDLKNRVRFAFNVSCLLDDTIRASVDPHVENIVKFCLAFDTAVDSTHIASELSHMLRSRERAPSSEKKNCDDGDVSEHDEVREDNSPSPAAAGAFPKPNFFVSAKSSEVLCKAIAEVLRRDINTASQIASGVVERHSSRHSNRNFEEKEKTKKNNDGEHDVADDDDFGEGDFLKDAALQKRRARFHEVRRCYLSLLSVLSLSLRWAAARSPSSRSSLSVVQRWGDGAVPAAAKQRGERRKMLDALNDAPWRQMHVVAFVITSTLTMLDSRQQQHWGGRVVNRHRSGAIPRGLSGDNLLFFAPEGRRFAIHALNQCDAAIADVQQQQHRQAERTRGGDDHDAVASEKRVMLVRQLPGTLRILSALHGAATRYTQKQQQQKIRSERRQQQKPNRKAADEDDVPTRIIDGVEACLQNILAEMNSAFLPIATSGGESSSSSSSASSASLLPGKQLLQIFASLGFLRAASFETLLATARPLRVCSLTADTAAPVQQQAALVSFVLNSLQQKADVPLRKVAALRGLVAEVERDADSLVCRSVRAICAILERERDAESSRNNGQHQQPPPRLRRAARRYEQAVSLLKLIVRCPDVLLPKTTVALCDTMVPLLLESIFSQLEFPQQMSKASAWLDFRDVMRALVVLRRQQQQSAAARNFDSDVVASLARAEEHVVSKWHDLATKRIEKQRNSNGRRGEMLFALFEHTDADFRLAQQMVPELAAWAARTGNGEVLKSVLKDMVTLVFAGIVRLQLRQEDEDGNIVAVPASAPVDRSKKHLVWMSMLRSCVERISAELDDCGQDPVDVDDALAVPRAWSSAQVQKAALFARLPSTEETRSLRQWYAEFWKKTYPILVPSRKTRVSDTAAAVANEREPSSSSAAESKAEKQQVEELLGGAVF